MTDSKSVVPQGTVGSNPTLSASYFAESQQGFEAERALTECQKSGQGWPRQRVQGSRRRNRCDAGDEVGESHPLRQLKQGVSDLWLAPCFFMATPARVAKPGISIRYPPPPVSYPP